jgi:hypothetical protein
LNVSDPVDKGIAETYSYWSGAAKNKPVIESEMVVQL